MPGFLSESDLFKRGRIGYSSPLKNIVLHGTTQNSGGNTVTQSWDLLIQGAKVFDGSGALPSIQDVAVRNGKIVARGDSLPAVAAAEVVDGWMFWLMPGMLDIHTHLDLEVDVEPALPEVVRLSLIHI